MSDISYLKNIKKQHSARNAYIFMLPEHGNIGDYAIGFAEQQFLSDYFGELNVVGITTPQWLAHQEEIIEKVYKDDIVFLNGGGYFGDLWEESYLYENIIEVFADNTKIMFPNTLTYKNNTFDIALKKDVEWFSKQRDLYLFFREKHSNAIFANAGGTSDAFIDMALYMSFAREKHEQNRNVMLCMRSDREKLFDYDSRIKEELRAGGYTYYECDLFKDRRISQAEGREIFQTTIESFQECDCIITDRLHGMIISAISNVPCVAIDNYTHKLKYVYENGNYVSTYVLLEDTYDDSFIKYVDMAIEKKEMAGVYIKPQEAFTELACRIKEIIE
ncbi:polysaccharide pyruvyl transferase family protein [Butyrivibrio sp. FCS006]|uniref:polysaccharide pyruvyl transferase family protein n=1 Tax=Butyrivibrio sp. FCS006 TaxID=1280684 RepID=UPI000400962A|nr:polysaccharide pyruvyl transferase family protein [Butyrivibrio sp. FCS006]